MMMEESYSGREVRLEGDQRDRARGAENEVVSSLTAMAGVILEAMEGPTDRDIAFQSARVREAGGAHVLIVHGPEYCYVYDGNVGICRPCTPEEEVQSD
jgi:hypothetical protein